MILRLQELARKKPNTLYVCFIEHTIAYNAVDRSLLGAVFARFSVSQGMISLIQQFLNVIRACVRLYVEVSSGWLAVDHDDPRQGCVLAPLLFNTFYVVDIDVAYTIFKVDNDTMDALMHSRKKPEGRGGS